MEQTLGEKRVRTDFNVKSNSAVDHIKQKTAYLITNLEEMRVSGAFDNGEDSREFNRLVSLAQTSYEEAAMWAVKAATF